MANELIKLDMVDDLNNNGIRVERKKRKKRKSIVKRLAMLSLVLLLCVGVYKAFPYIKSLELPNLNLGENSDTPPSENNESDKNNDENDTNEENKGNENDTNGNDDTSQKENEEEKENSDTNQDPLPNGHYVINSGKDDFKIENSSACDIDFSKEISTKTAKEIYEEYGTGAPVVLITHFSSRECYSNGKSYTPQGVFYSNEKNIGNVGELITSELNSLGINTIHLNEIYASGAIFSSREEYEISLEKTLKAYPSIAYVINLSRDVIVNDNMTMTKKVFSIDDASYAQLSLSVGTNYSEITEFQEKNLLFAKNLSSYLNTQYDNFVASYEISRFSLSQNVTPVCFNLEIGSYANAYEEAIASASLFAKCFSDLIE